MAWVVSRHPFVSSHQQHQYITFLTGNQHSLRMIQAKARVFPPSGAIRRAGIMASRSGPVPMYLICGMSATAGLDSMCAHVP